MDWISPQDQNRATAIAISERFVSEPGKQYDDLVSDLGEDRAMAIWNLACSKYDQLHRSDNG